MPGPATSISTATRAGLCGSVKARMLVTVVRDRLVAPAMLPEPVHRLCRKPKTSNFFLETSVYYPGWVPGFPRPHTWVLLCTAHDLRGSRLREIEATADITGRSTH